MTEEIEQVQTDEIAACDYAEAFKDTNPHLSDKWIPMDPGPVPHPEVGPPIVLYSFGFDAEQLLTVYNALRTYLRVSVQQDNEDLETIERITKMLIEIKPRAVEASKHLTEKRNARTD